MDKAFFRESFASYTDDELLAVIQDKANMQQDAVEVANELLVSRGQQSNINALEGHYNKEISDITKRIGNLKIARGLSIFGLFIVYGIVFLFYGGNSAGNDKTEREIFYQRKQIFIIMGIIVIAAVTGPFTYKIEKLKQQKKEEKAIIT